ncbi:MAG: hypothetical protein KKH72_11945 [Alphaproteobacteria bacterium]|nr:hypothetical protein [Alphaproteobacteria bacterium]
MSYILLRIAIYALIAGALYFGVRRIFLDWKGRFREIDKAKRDRDLKERQRPDVIDLKRGEDGVYRRKDDADKQ